MLFSGHQLNRHRIRRDSGRQDVYKCDYCEYLTDKISRLEEHTNAHLKRTPYICKQCSRGFAAHYSLSVHIKTMHQEKTLACTHCAFKAATSTKLRDHVRTMHTHRGVKPYKCGYCDFHSAVSGNARKHCMRNHVGEPVKWVKDGEFETLKEGEVKPYVPQPRIGKRKGKGKKGIEHLDGSLKQEVADEGEMKNLEVQDIAQENVDSEMVALVNSDKLLFKPPNVITLYTQLPGDQSASMGSHSENDMMMVETQDANMDSLRDLPQMTLNDSDMPIKISRKPIKIAPKPSPSSSEHIPLDIKPGQSMVGVCSMIGYGSHMVANAQNVEFCVLEGIASDQGESVGKTDHVDDVMPSEDGKALQDCTGQFKAEDLERSPYLTPINTDSVMYIVLNEQLTEGQD